MSQPLSIAALKAIQQEEKDPCQAYCLDDPNCPEDLKELSEMVHRFEAKNKAELAKQKAQQQK